MRLQCLHIFEKFLNSELLVLLLYKPMGEKTNKVGSDQVQHKPSCTVTEDGKRLEILDLESRRTVLCLVAKTKALISFAVTTKLICAFVFAYADCWFSHVVAHI